MKRLFSLLFALLAASACGSPQDDQSNSYDPTLGQTQEGLVYVNGQWVQQCSAQKSRCDGSIDYQVCAFAVESPGTELWLDGGSCNSGYHCQEQNTSDGVQARCVSGSGTGGSGGSGGSGGGNSGRAISCVTTGSDYHLRCTVTGPITGGGLVEDPTSPQYLEYGADDGVAGDWTVPYQSGTTRQKVASNGGVGPFTLNLKPNVTKFSFYLTDRNSTTRDSWFNYQNGDWDVSGDVEIGSENGELNLYPIGTGPGGGTCQDNCTCDCGCDVCGGGTSGGPRSITCDASGSNVVMTIVGPIQAGLISTVTNPKVIEIGSNTPYDWTVSTLGKSGRPTATWISDTAPTTLYLPANADGINLFVATAVNSTNGQYLDLNGTYWTIGGDCYQSGTLIRVRH